MLKWKPLNGRHAYELEARDVDKMAKPARLEAGELFPQTTGFMKTMQDQGISNNNCQKYSLKYPNIVTDICRKCGEKSETIQHIDDACRALTSGDDTHRHNQVANSVHHELAIKCELPKGTPMPYCKYVLQSVLEKYRYKLCYERYVTTCPTDQTQLYLTKPFTKHT